MIVKTIIDEDFTNYKKPSMLIAMPRCTMKCGEELCQNSPWLKQPDIKINTRELVERYLNNNLTHAIVFGGLDPIDTFSDLWYFIVILRRTYKCNDDVVIYTGYTEDEIEYYLETLRMIDNIIVKLLRFFYFLI